jgi:hypothetical protein
MNNLFRCFFCSISNIKKVFLYFSLICISNIVMAELSVPVHAWHTFYAGAPDNASAQAIASKVDNFGNIIIVGTSLKAWVGNNSTVPVHAFTQQDSLFVLKLSPQGEYIWHTFLGRSTRILEHYITVSIDQGNNIYVAGNSHVSWNGPLGQSPLNGYHGGTLDGFIVKINDSGTYQWHTFIGSSGGDALYDIDIDSLGKVYVLGESIQVWSSDTGDSPLNLPDETSLSLSALNTPFILKIDETGNYVWHTFYGKTTQAVLFQGALEIDPNDNIYVTGVTYVSWLGENDELPLHPISNSSALVSDLYALKLDSSGAYQWHTFYGSGATGFTAGMALDIENNLYISGRANAAWLGDNSTGPLNNYQGATDIYTLKLSKDGTYRWHTYFGSNNNDMFSSITINSFDHIFITGQSSASWFGPLNESPINAYIPGGREDGVTFSLTLDGDYRWHTFMQGTPRSVQPSGNTIYLSGDNALFSTTEPDLNIFGVNTPSPLRGNDGLFALKYDLQNVVNNDTTPDSFTFIDRTGVSANQLIVSNTITINGINTAAAISISNGEYQINSGVFTSLPGTIINGQTVTVRVASAGTSNSASAILTVGGVFDSFDISVNNAGSQIPGGSTQGSNTSGGGGSTSWEILLCISILLSLLRATKPNGLRTLS